MTVRLYAPHEIIPRLIQPFEAHFEGLRLLDFSWINPVKTTSKRPNGGVKLEKKEHMVVIRINTKEISYDEEQRFEFNNRKFAVKKLSDGKIKITRYQDD